jgi:hypothetical protein
MGPGTHVIDRILKGVAPTSYTDAVALQHDIDYLTDKDPIISDLKAIWLADNTMQGVVMKTGLVARSVVDLLTRPIGGWKINGRTDTLPMQSDELAMKLRELVKNNNWEPNNYVSSGASLSW